MLFLILMCFWKNTALALWLFLDNFGKSVLLLLTITNFSHLLTNYDVTEENVCLILKMTALHLKIMIIIFFAGK